MDPSTAPARCLVSNFQIHSSPPYLCSCSSITLFLINCSHHLLCLHVYLPPLHITPTHYPIALIHITGNWSEEISLNKAKLDDFKARCASGSSNLRKLQSKMSKCSTQVPLVSLKMALSASETLSCSETCKLPQCYLRPIQ